MKMRWNILVQLFILFVFATCVDAVQRFIEMPTYTEVNPGEDALLKCRISDKKGVCSWQKDNKPVGIYRGKYEWANENSPVGGDCSLWVRAATLQLDDGQWQCQVTASNYDVQDALSSPPAALAVRVPPQSPRILFNGSHVMPGQNITVPAGNRATVVCEARYGNPPAYIEWYLEKERLTAWSQTNASEVERPRVWAARSVLELGATRSAHGRQLACRAHHPSYPSPYYRDSYTMLDVTFVPVVSIVGGDASTLANLEEGSSALTLECRADGNPSPYVWWTKNGQVIATNGAKLILAPVSRNHSGIYGCQARNSLGTSDSVKIEIDIKYPPRVSWIGPDTVVEANLFSQVTLECKAEGNPPPSYTWYHSPASSARINSLQDGAYPISMTPQLQLHNVSYDQHGRYTCVATNQIGLEDRSHQSEAVTLNVLGPPVGADTGAAHAWSGHEARVAATVCADPPPRRAAWLWGSLRLDVPSQIGRYRTIEPATDGGCYRYTLLISNTGVADARVYVLHVENERGFSSHAVSLTVHDNFSLTETAHVAPLIAAALVIAALLVIVLCLIIRCRRRRESVEYKTEDLDSEKAALPADAVYTPREAARPAMVGGVGSVAGIAAGGGGAGGGAGAAAAHPAAHAHAVLPLPLARSVRDVLADHRPPVPIMEDTTKVCMNSSPTSAGTSVLRSASDTAITTVAEAWELSLAAASASKDKRVKDVKNTSLKQQNNKKRQTKTSNDASVLSVTDDLIESSIRVQVPGLEGFIPPSTTLAQLAAAVPHTIGPHLSLTLHLNTNGEAWSGPMWEGASSTSPSSPGAGPSSSSAGTTSSSAASTGGSAILRWFGAVGGLALVAARLPRPHAPPPDPPALVHHHHDLDWVKLDDPYEEVVELGVAAGGGGVGGGAEEGGCTGVPAHALLALGLLLKLPGYADALLDEGARACHLLRLLLGVTHDEDGRSIAVGEGRGAGGAGSLGTLPFTVVARLLERAPLQSAAGRALRRALLQRGAVRLLLACLAVFTHHRPNSNDNSQGSNGSTGKSEEKSQLYWAKGTGFGTGSTQQSWNVEQALVRQRTEEEHVTVLLQVLASYMNPGEKWPPEEGAAETTDREDSDDSHDLPAEFIDLIANSSLVPAICSYLRNDSVLDMSRHIPLYVHVLRCARALSALGARRLAPALRPLPRLLACMSRTTNSYATKLRMSKKNIFGKMTYSQRFSTSSNSELSEEDEGLAALIADIQATSALLCRSENEAESGRASGAPAPLSGATREARYIELMRTMQFETFEMIAECAESGFRFLVPYHFEGAVRAAGERAHPARMKRLAQEAATLATSLPLSYSSSVFVRTDADRLDVMKVLITGPSDTPYANGCFVLDVYFPAEYPAVPMLINLETTGRHSVRFNPNLYNDGKVCLSVLNTWHGRPEEKWNAHTSSFLQVLVSIQSLILVPEPYFNEPGYERSRGTRVGSSASLEYNSNIYQACVRWAMLDHLRNPEPCFKEVIQTHFWIKRNEIMQTVANWITELESQSGDERTQRSIQLNLMALKRHYVKLQEELAKLPVPAGLEELDEPFQLPAAPEPAPQTPAPPTNDEIDHDMEKIVSQVLD